MRKHLGISAFVAVTISCAAFTAQAQDKAVELTAGLLGYTSTSYSCSGCSSLSASTFRTGGAYAAAGFYLSPGLAIEPWLAIASLSSEGNTASSWTIGVGVPIYFAKEWGRKGWYLTPAVRFLSESCTGCSAETQFGLAASVGYKVALNANAALRIHASYDYGMESSSTKTTTSAFGIGFGLSAFIK